MLQSRGDDWIGVLILDNGGGPCFVDGKFDGFRMDSFSDMQVNKGRFHTGQFRKCCFKHGLDVLNVQTVEVVEHRAVAIAHPRSSSFEPPDGLA